jgi:archaellum component FlaG (FlaF/FlaG flagellin family)
MNEIILFRALFFIAMILLAASIVTVVAFGASLVSRSRSKIKRQKKAKIARKWNPFAISGRNREDPFPKSTTLTIDNCWLHRI